MHESLLQPPFLLPQPNRTPAATAAKASPGESASSARPRAAMRGKRNSARQSVLSWRRRSLVDFCTSASNAETLLMAALATTAEKTARMKQNASAKGSKKLPSGPQKNRSRQDATPPPSSTGCAFAWPAMKTCRYLNSESGKIQDAGLAKPSKVTATPAKKSVGSRGVDCAPQSNAGRKERGSLPEKERLTASAKSQDPSFLKCSRKGLRKQTRIRRGAGG